MTCDIKLGVLGGDMRQYVLACGLAAEGFEVAAYGFDLCDGSSCDTGAFATKCSSPECAIRASSAVILPIPASSDNIILNCPLSSRGGVRICDILDKCSGKLVIGGKLSPQIRAMCTERGIEYVDFYEREELQIANAVPTAEGAVETALRELSVTLFGADAVICGYGRIAKVLSPLLRAFGAKVTVVARRREPRAWCDALGFNSADMSELGDAVKNADVIFNTVPQTIITSDILKNMKKSTVIIDLASKPGGVDLESSKEHGIKTVWALALPGKTAPISAGRIILKTVLDILAEKGVCAQ